ncbi:hypothetical protein LCGC14_1727460 [marine sediment metagenome]|uniref:Uncharacterized protein n=1 Tax=marine sediment metagenome TaxID=412755 RepID=A0A0F9HAK8_9ZZZZ
MVMAAEMLRRQRGQNFQARDLTGIPDEMREDVEIWDYHWESGEEAKWLISTPVKIIMDNLPIGARVSPDYGFYRKVIAGVGSCVVFILAFAVSLTMLHPYLAAFPSLIVACVGAGLGYWKGARFAPAPFWTCRRLWNPDGTIEIRPIVHTLLKGESSLRIDGAKNGHNKQVKVAGFDAPPEDVFVPNVHRATTLYEDLKMRTERADMRAPRDTWEKIQLGAVGLLAGGLVLGLIFIVAITTN